MLQRMRLRVSSRAKRLALPPVPLRPAQDMRWSVISSVSDLKPAPSEALISIMLEASKAAQNLRLHELEARSDPDYSQWIATWPGEHYRFLAALVTTHRPNHIVEIGT